MDKSGKGRRSRRQYCCSQPAMRLALLWWKDWTWFRGHWIGLVVSCLLPALFSVGYCVFNGGDYTPRQQQEVIVSHDRLPFFPKDYKPPFFIQVLLPVSTVKTESVAFRQFCGNLCAGFNFTDYKDDGDFVRTDEHTAFLIVEEWDVEKPSLKYRYVDFQWKLQSLLSPLWGLWSLDQKGRSFREQDGYAALTQRMIDTHFYRRRECFSSNNTCPRSRNMDRLPFDGPYEMAIKHSAMPLFNPPTSSTATLFAQMTIFFALVEIWQLANQLAAERKAKTKIFLQGLGVSRPQYFLAFFVPLYFKFLLMQFILWVVPPFMLKNALSFHVIFPGILIYSATLSSFALLLATLFHNPLSVKLGSIAILFILHLGQFGLEEKSGMTDTFISASLLFPNAYYYYHRAATTRQAVGGFVPNNGITSLIEVPFLVLSTVVMFLFVIYFDTIFPGDDRKGLPWAFLFYPSYWIRKGRPPLYEADSFMKDGAIVDEASVSMSDAVDAERVCAIKIEGLCKAAGSLWLVNRVTMKAFYNEITVLFGPRGAGGEEMMALIAGQLDPDYGQIEFKDAKKPLVAISANPCFVPQMTVRELAAWVARMRGGSEDEALNMVAELSLAAVEQKPVGQLTAVQEQQLHVLLAFVGDPEVVLLGEPTKNCPPEIKNIILAFIVSHKTGKAVLMSSYDHVEAEIGDNVAFFSHGHLVTYGSVYGVRSKFGQLLNFVIWPGANFTKHQRALIEKLLIQELPVDLPRPTWEMMGNESIRFCIAFSATVPVHRIIEQMENNREELGIKYLEVQRQNLYDAYYNCIRPWEQKDELELRALPIPLKQLYDNPKRRSFWPELRGILQMNIAFAKVNWITCLLYLVVPILVLVFLSFVSMMYSRHVTESEIGLDMLEEGVVGPVQILTNMKLRSELPEGVAVTDKGGQQMLRGELLYNEPPIVVGLVRNETAGFIHLYTMKLLRFGELLVQNLFINSIIASKSQEQVVHMWIESQDSPEWAGTSFDRANTWIPEMNSRELATVVIRQWATVMIIGGMLGVVLARSALFVAKLAGDNCIKMHYLMGARPLWYWLAIALMDLGQFLIGLMLAAPLLILLTSMGGVTLCISAVLCLMAFVTTLPCIYILALRYRDYFMAICTSLVFIGALAILPACIPFFVRQYGATLEEWTEIFVVFAFLCPPLAASLGSALCNDLMINEEKTTMEAIMIIYPLLLASCVHLWLWLFVVTWSTSRVQRLLTKASFWWKGKTTDPKLLGAPKDGGVYFNDSNSIAIPTPVVASSTSVTSAKSGRATAGKTRALQSTTNMDTDYQTSLRTDVSAKNVSAISAKAEIGALKGDFHKTSKSAEAETVMGLWELRDENAPKTPVLSFDNVQLDHYCNNAQLSFSVYDLQAICLMGDSPKARSYILDLAAGQAYPNSGTVTINGIDANRTTGAGYVPIDDRLCSFLTGRQTLEMAARLKGCSDIGATADYLIGLTELDEVADRRVAEYGVSDRRMLHFAIAIVDLPSCLLLDELDASVSPTRMRTVWAVACFLRQLYSVPILFSSSRVYESEAGSSHAVMLLQGDIVLAETTAGIKKRYSGLVSLTLSVKKPMEPETVISVVVGQLHCDLQFHPNPTKLSFFVNILPGKFVETVTRVRSLMATIGIEDYSMDTPDLYLIYHANFTNSLEV